MAFVIGCQKKNTLPGVTELSQEQQATQAKAVQLCSACHGFKGISTSPLIPNLAGQKETYMIKQLQDFSSGKRTNHPPMSYIARMLTEKEITLISAWYASLPIEPLKNK